ncbi:male-specific lethal 1-like 1 isoform X2 [Brachyhypopomus gauderio]|uniref:male-specific lethal 1-like 1 isoform X2 n=1 Tax=Brachyhypopomus gauderio TaxID=698409 RepID=UPI004042ED6C
MWMGCQEHTADTHRAPPDCMVGVGWRLSLAMTTPSTLFISGGNKLDTDISDQIKQVESTGFTTGSKKGSCKSCVRVPAVLSNIHNSSRQRLLSKTKTLLSRRSAVSRLGQSPAVRKGQEENWVNLGASTLPLANQMGAEGTPSKSKSLFGQASNNHMGKMDIVASNGSKQPRKSGPVGGLAMAGAPSPEQGPDGKRRNIMKASVHAATQTGCIRQILLLQLELIEQQQQQLQSKNKEIDDLKAEKEMLMARIERMERRLQMVKKDGAESRPTLTPRRRETVGPVSAEGTGHSEGPSHTPRQMHFGRGGKGLKRRFLFQESRMARSRRGQPRTPSPRESQVLKEETREEVLLPCVSPCLVPSWRESIVEPLEGKKATDVPENLDDGVFLKRHSKLELDEKRRKRWDIQRIREQRIFQRLQQRTSKRKVIQASEPELLSFYPEAEHVESIMITPFLPVVAFGRPLPNLKQQNFDIPWLDERSRYRQEVSKKKTPHRTCRK